MKLQKRDIFMIAAAFVMISAVIMLNGALTKGATEADIRLDKANSCFSGFTVEGEKVYLECVLEVVNDSGEEAEVAISADFSEDAQIGLLEEGTLRGYRDDRQTDTFLLKEGSQTITVVFIGDFDGNPHKVDRLLPHKIEINKLKMES